MDNVRRSEYLRFFSRVGLLYKRTCLDPLWARYPEATNSIWDSLGVFVEGYAFERQGRPPSFPAVAADVISELRSGANGGGSRGQASLDAAKAWGRFSQKLNGDRLNTMNNPLAPKGTQYRNKKGNFQTSKSSAVEVAAQVAQPLVQWVLQQLKENHAEVAHAKINEITGIDQKIPSFFLRDIACRYRVFPSESRSLLQPIDTWVRRSAMFLGASGDDRAVAQFIVKMAEDGGYEPERINQGMWYFGAEIAGSEYLLTQALADLARAEVLLKEHLASFPGWLTLFRLKRGW